MDTINTQGVAPSFPLATIQSSLGFAYANTAGEIISANHGFYKLLGIPSPRPAIRISGHIAQVFTSSIADFEKVLSNPLGGVIELEEQPGKTIVRLHIAELIQGHRIIVAEQKPHTIFNQGPQHDDTFKDSLTQLGNRKLLYEVINSRKTTQAALPLSAIMMDLDRFKQINDTLGHHIGDKLLQLVGKRIQRATRAKDTVTRIGGDEFIILHTEDQQPDGAVTLAKRLIDLIKRPFLIDGFQINIGTSIGIATQSHKTSCFDNLLKHADLALYEAKKAGRGTYRIFHQQLQQRANDRRELELSLRRALHLEEFAIFYQPQVSLPERKVTGFEALIRWIQPDKGMVSPSDFIPLAEETGEINAIGKWVLQTACQTAMTWPENLTIAVNVSPIQFENGHLVHDIKAALEQSGLDPKRLELEITEGLLIKNIEDTIEQLWAIQETGVSIAMDDFGTGYSSLSYLNSFPFSKLKIDQSFLRGEQTSKSSMLIKAILSLGKSLGMQTLAEGVESEDQYTQLTLGGCMAAQGYLISKPIPAGEIAAFLAKNEM